jgi:hypothetical protein
MCTLLVVEVNLSQLLLLPKAALFRVIRQHILQTKTQLGKDTPIKQHRLLISSNI